VVQGLDTQELHEKRLGIDGSIRVVGSWMLHEGVVDCSPV
jgi:hypothetical protein